MTSDSYPNDVTYVDESIALIIMNQGGVAKYVMTTTSISFAMFVLASSDYYSLLFFPGSKS